MKIITVAIILAVVAIDANAAWGPKYGSEDSCIVERKNGRKFYFCGQSQSECAGYKVLKWSTQKAFQNEKSFTSEFDSSRTFYCCNPDGGARGVWKEGKSWYVTNKVATKQLENGTCNYQRRINICGGDESTDCTVPDTCTNGTFMRNDECVTNCPDGSVFESETSNVCITCETTEFQGINKDQECVQCDPDTEFFDLETKTCVAKAELTHITKEMMMQCHKCPNNVLFYDCCKMLSMSESERTNMENYEQIVNDCQIRQ